ncbi:membrane protein [Tatumella saanichensis]|nr:membrane protein [Tatumella saanichensis]
MNLQKTAIIGLFLLMALGGIGGLMLVGYAIVLHA